MKKLIIRWVLMGGLFLLLGLIEHCTGPLWWHCNPPYLLCAVVLCAMFSGEKAASLYGLFSGLFADAMTAGVFGLHGAIYLIVGYLVAFLTEKILSRNVFSCTLTALLFVGLNEALSYLIVTLGSPISLSAALQYVFLPRLVMSLPVILILYVLFVLLYREREAYPTRRRLR